MGIPTAISKSLIHKSVTSQNQAGFHRFQGVLHQSASKKGIRLSDIGKKMESIWTYGSDSERSQALGDVMWCVGDSVLLGLSCRCLAAQGQTDCAQDASETCEEPVSLWI